MKVLLDTNIIIHREMKHPAEKDIGKMFGWLDRLHYEKCIHEVTVEEIQKMQDPQNREGYFIKMESYTRLQTVAPLRPEVNAVSKKFDKTENDRHDTILINELFSGRVDLLITEDRNIHSKAKELGLEDKVYSIEEFLEKVTADYPELIDIKVPSVKKEYFGNIDLNDEFFNSFKEDYAGYEKWFNKKANDIAYVVKFEEKIGAFLYLKPELESEPYPDISPMFRPNKRLKIGTMKVQLNGYKLGERLLKIVFDNAMQLNVNEIYVTIFPKRMEQLRLISLLKDFGFYKYGTKTSSSGVEEVYTRDFSRKVSASNPKTTFPFVSRNARKFIVPIYQKYHTSLFPDSILRTESPIDFVEHEPFRNAISKVYVSRSINRDLNPGDIIVFYRTGGYYKSVITTLGIVESVHSPINSEEEFVGLCRKRSVFSEKELKGMWEDSPYNRPFVVNFLYAYSFPKRINLKSLIDLGIIRDVDSAPRGFEQMSSESFEKIIKETDSNESIIVD